MRSEMKYFHDHHNHWLFSDSQRTETTTNLTINPPQKIKCFEIVSASFIFMKQILLHPSVSYVHNGFVLFRFPLRIDYSSILFCNIVQVALPQQFVYVFLDSQGHPSVYPFCALCFLWRHVCTTRNEKQDIPHNILGGNGNIIRIFSIHDCDAVDGRSKTNHHSQ